MTVTPTTAGLNSRIARPIHSTTASSVDSGPAAEPVLDRVRERLADDLDTPAALTAVDRWADEALTRGGPSTTAPDLVRDLTDALLGLAL